MRRGASGQGADELRPHRQPWYHGVPSSDRAHQWAQHVHPVYSISFIGLRMGYQYLVRIPPTPPGAFLKVAQGTTRRCHTRCGAASPSRPCP